MARHDWTSASRCIKKSTNLATSPVGVSLIREAKDLVRIPGVRFLTKTAPCHMAAVARYYREEGIVGASSEGVRCILGSSCLGLVEAPDRVKAGKLNIPYTSGEKAAKALQGSIAMIGTEGRRYGALLMAPLDLVPVEPDVIVIYLTPAQALRLIIGFAYKEGEAPRTTMTGQGSLCASIAKVMKQGEVVFDIPCIGDRAYGLVEENEMLVAFPAGRVDYLIEGLKATESTSSHPFKPFLGWPVVLPPEFDLRPNEIS